MLIALPRKLPAHSHRAIEEDEVKRMIAEIEGGSFISFRNLLILLMLWDTGVRVTELCRMQISDLDLQKRQAVIATEKREIMRIILWSESTNTHLIKYLEIHKRHFQKAGDRVIPLFVASRSRRKIECLTRESVERIVGYYAHKAGIQKKTTPHTFRHGWAHIRRDLGAPLSFVQKGLGHSSPVSTQVYQQFTDPEFVKAGKGYFASPYCQPQPFIGKEIIAVPSNMNRV
jgi:integrase/recombinase XerD